MAVDTPKIDFLPWYAPNNAMLRCEGADGCGALVMSDDAERHLIWHQSIFYEFKRIAENFETIRKAFEPVKTDPKVEPRRTTIDDIVCSDPNCSTGKRRPHRKTAVCKA